MSAPGPGDWVAPFTPAQVAALNEYQQSNPDHPYLCDDETHPPLRAMDFGWYCYGRGCIVEQRHWSLPHVIRLRHHLIGADLPGHSFIAGDGQRSYAVHTAQEAADRALRALWAWFYSTGSALDKVLAEEIRTLEVRDGVVGTPERGPLP